MDHISNSSNPSYSDLIEKYNISDSSTIPSSQALGSLRSDLRNLEESAKARSRNCDKMLRELQQKIEAKRSDTLRIEGEERKRVTDDADRKDKMMKKKRRAESQSGGDHKRPPAVGAHQPANQTLESVAQSRPPKTPPHKKLANSYQEKRRS